jgi:hypothetical protein
MAVPVSTAVCMTTARNEVLDGTRSPSTEYCITTGACGLETELRVITLLEREGMGTNRPPPPPPHTHTHTHKHTKVHIIKQQS